MSMDFNLERDAFNAFLDAGHPGHSNPGTLEAALIAFRAYQRDLDRLKAKLQPSIDQADRGEAKPLNLDALLDRVKRRIEQQGNR